MKGDVVLFATDGVCEANDPDGVASMQLLWRVDGGTWTSTSMALADGRYSANIPGHSAGTKIQFYVAGVDGLGASSTFPAAGSDSGAYYVVDDGQADNAISNLRIIMATADINAQATATKLDRRAAILRGSFTAFRADVASQRSTTSD